MKIELVFTKRTNGFDDGQMIVGKFTTKKAAYAYVKCYRKFFCSGFFGLFINKSGLYYYEPVRAQDILNV